MECAVDGRFGCRIEEHYPIVATSASVAVGVHLVEVALGEPVVLLGGIQDLVLGVHQEAFAVGVSEDEVHLHVELPEQLAERALRLDVGEAPSLAKFYAILVSPQERGDELFEQRVHVEYEGQLLYAPCAEAGRVALEQESAHLQQRFVLTVQSVQPDFREILRPHGQI